HGTEDRVGCESLLRVEVEVSQGQGFASGLRGRNAAWKGMKRDSQDDSTHKEQPAQAAQALHETSIVSRAANGGQRNSIELMPAHLARRIAEVPLPVLHRRPFRGRRRDSSCR